MHSSQFHNKPLSGFTFLVTGGAGFIGSHLVEYLLSHGAGKVRVLDNLLTGKESNINLFRGHRNFEFINGDIRNSGDCRMACEGIDFVLHQAALASVQRSMKDPVTTHAINADGFLNMLIAVRDAKVKRLVYASSSSVYGDHPALPKKEENTGNPLSPYAVSKKTNELYAHVFSRSFNMEIIGLRYFNVFGPRQDPKGPYAAVIPAFIRDLKKGTAPVIYGDGKQTRDFTYVENAVQANIRSLFTENRSALSRVYNVAYGQPSSIAEIFNMLSSALKVKLEPRFENPRPGDIAHSLADISLASTLLGYQPEVNMQDGLNQLLA